MAQRIWNITFACRKVDGSVFPTPMEQHRLDDMQVPQAIKAAAEKIAERFDFPFVQVTAKPVDGGPSQIYTHQSDSGFRSEWQTGRQ